MILLFFKKKIILILFNLKNEINIINLIFIIKLDFKIKIIKFQILKINKTISKNYKIIIIIII